LKYDHLEPRKDIHIKLMRETHSAFRIASFNHKLSMQEMIEEFAALVVEEDPRAMKIIKDLKRKKRDRAISRITKTDSETLYDIINDSGD